MPYIPKEHEKYDLLPLCWEDGGEVFDYDDGLLYEAEKLLDSSESLFPYNYESYFDYFQAIDSLIAANEAKPETKKILCRVRDTVRDMNQKEEWSVLKYLGPTDDSCFGLTHGKNYYWPTRKGNPVYCGVIDDEEFTAYLYPTEASLWEILLDPTGMAYRTIYEHGNGYVSQAKYDDYMDQIGRQLAEDEK